MGHFPRRSLGAAALDALSSQGIYRALDAGLRAAHAIENLDGDGLNQYSDRVETNFAKYLLCNHKISAKSS